MLAVRTVPVRVVVADRKRQDVVLRLLPLRQRLASGVQGLEDRVAVLVTIQADVDDLQVVENGLGERRSVFVASVFGNLGDPFRDRVSEVAVAVVERQRVVPWRVGDPNRGVDNSGKACVVTALVRDLVLVGRPLYYCFRIDQSIRKDGSALRKTNFLKG